MTCKPNYLGHIKYMREHPPALQVKTRGATDQWGFFYQIPQSSNEEFDKKSSRCDAHKTRREGALAPAFWRLIGKRSLNLLYLMTIPTN